MSCCLDSPVCWHHAQLPTPLLYECLYPGLSSFIINFDWHGCITATVFYFLVGGEEMCENEMTEGCCKFTLPKEDPCLIAFLD